MYEVRLSAGSIESLNSVLLSNSFLFYVYVMEEIQSWLLKMGANIPVMRDRKVQNIKHEMVINIG